MNLGQLFVLEGGEGVGKTTIATQLKELLDPQEFVFVREPGGTPLGMELRRLLLDSTIQISPECELLLFMTARFVVFEKVIGPALLAGKHVITDRLDASTYAYQIRGRQMPKLENLFWAMREQYLELPGGALIEPFYIWFKLDPEIGSERIRVDGRETNHLDLESTEFHRRVYEGYKYFIPRMSRYATVDASRSRDEVYGEVESIILKITGLL